MYAFIAKYGVIKVLLFLFIPGLVAGVIFANAFQSLYIDQFFLFDDSYVESVTTVQLDQLILFQMALLKYLKEFFLMGLLSTTIIGIPCLFLHNFYKGFCIGFIISTATMRFGIQGILFFLCYCMPHYLLLGPLWVYLYYKGIALNQALYQKTETHSVRFSKYIPIIFVVLIIIGIASYLEASINAGLMKKIMLSLY